MKNEYQDYILCIRDSLIENGIGLEAKELYDYSDLFILTENIADILWFHDIVYGMNIFTLRGKFFEGKEFYLDKVREQALRAYNSTLNYKDIEDSLSDVNNIYDGDSQAQGSKKGVESNMSRLSDRFIDSADSEEEYDTTELEDTELEDDWDYEEEDSSESEGINAFRSMFTNAMKKQSESEDKVDFTEEESEDTELDESDEAWSELTDSDLDWDESDDTELDDEDIDDGWSEDEVDNNESDGTELTDKVDWSEEDNQGYERDDTDTELDEDTEWSEDDENIDR